MWKTTAWNMCDIKGANQNWMPEEDTEQLKFGECLLPFSTEFFSHQGAV
jgi:hypothetical protein